MGTPKESMPVCCRAMWAWRNSQCPECIIIGMVRSDAVTGSFDRDPFHLQSFGSEPIELHVEGMREGQLYNPSFTTGVWLARSYAHMAAVCKRYETNDPLSIMMEQ